MMLLILGGWAMRILLNTLSYAHLWWMKEYRWDRMRVHLRTAQGRRFWWPPLRRPPITPKTTALVAGSVAGVAWIIGALPWHPLARFLLADVVSFPMTWFLVLFLNAPVRVYHQVLLFLATRSLRAHRPMITVGITGSYGKTSTKEYLATILSVRYKTLKTEGSKNSAIGIAETVLANLRPDHEAFVVEMGAYKRGEIAQMTRMVRPQIGIMTAINPQHQDLFGTIENTMQAKYELMRGLTGRRIAIFNAQDARVQTMAKWGRRDGLDVWEGKLSATDIHARLDGLSFMVHLGAESASVRVPVLGKHQVSNLLLALSAAVACGMPLEEAARAASHIRPVPKVLEKVAGCCGATFINDTFNNNPDAARAALDVLSMAATGRKYLVFQPMIELGHYAAASHEAVGEYAGRICDEIVLTNRNFYGDFLRGVRKVSRRVPVTVMNPQGAAQHLMRKLARGDTVLFKGKEAEYTLKACKK